MNIDSFWILTALWILPFVVNNMLRSRKRLPLDRWHNPLKVAKTELLVFTGAALISIAYIFCQYLQSKIFIVNSYQGLVLLLIMYIYTTSLVTYLRLRLWINQHPDYAFFVLDSPHSWIKGHHKLHIGKMNGLKEGRGMSFSLDDEIFVVSGKHNFSFDILSRHGKSSSYLYTDYIDLDTAAGTMYVFKEKQNEKKLCQFCPRNKFQKVSDVYQLTGIQLLLSLCFVKVYICRSRFKTLPFVVLNGCFLALNLVFRFSISSPRTPYPRAFIL